MTPYLGFFYGGNMEIRIRDYTLDPVVINRNSSTFSAEEFREDVLSTKIMDCIQNEEKLLIDLDGVNRYTCGFVDEAFGGLIREGFSINILDNIEFKSNDLPMLTDVIKEFMYEEEEKKYVKCKRR